MVVRGGWWRGRQGGQGHDGQGEQYWANESDASCRRCQQDSFAVSLFENALVAKEKFFQTNWGLGLKKNKDKMKVKNYHQQKIPSFTMIGIVLQEKYCLKKNKTNTIRYEANTAL